MDSIRLAPAQSVFPKIACCRCVDGTRWWDRLAGKTFCPSCLEALAQGEADPLCEKVDKRRCAVCHHQGTLRYLTFPRLPAVAEVAWSPRGSRDWTSFRERLAAFGPRWTAAGITFHRTPEIDWH